MLKQSWKPDRPVARCSRGRVVRLPTLHNPRSGACFLWLSLDSPSLNSQAPVCVCVCIPQDACGKQARRIQCTNPALQIIIVAVKLRQDQIVRRSLIADLAESLPCQHTGLSYTTEPTKITLYVSMCRFPQTLFSTALHLEPCVNHALARLSYQSGHFFDQIRPL